MHKQRAEEIAASPVMANVTYQDTAIYIQHVNATNNTARIFPLDERDNEMEVPLESLIEH